jgi:hypothetical protein
VVVREVDGHLAVVARGDGRVELPFLEHAVHCIIREPRWQL